MLHCGRLLNRWQGQNKRHSSPKSKSHSTEQRGRQASVQWGALRKLAALKRTLLRQRPVQLNPSIQPQSVQTANQIRQVRVIQLQLKWLNTLTATAQNKLMTVVIGPDRNKAALAAKRFGRFG